MAEVHISYCTELHWCPTRKKKKKKTRLSITLGHETVTLVCASFAFFCEVSSFQVIIIPYKHANDHVAMRHFPFEHDAEPFPFFSRGAAKHFCHTAVILPKCYAGKGAGQLKEEQSAGLLVMTGDFNHRPE